MQEIEHFSPETLDEAAALLMAADTVSPLHAEGTRFAIQVTDGQHPCTCVVDLKRVPELNRLEYDERVGLRIGAAVPYSNILQFPPIRRVYPILADACGPPHLGEAGAHACFGMTLGNASASADIAPSLICLRASSAVFGPHGWSEWGVEGLLTGSTKASIQPGEFIVDLLLPPPPPRSGGAYFRSFLREASDQSAVGIGTLLVMEADLLTCCGGRLVYGTAARPGHRALDAERFLAGKRLEDAIVQEAAALAARNVEGKIDEGMPSRHRLEEIEVLTRGAILKALARTQAVPAP